MLLKPCSAYCSTDVHRVNGYYECALPGFDPSLDFTLAAWILVGGEHRANTAALTIQGYLRIGEWDQSGSWSVWRSCPSSNANDHFMLHASFKPGKWQYVAFVQRSDRISLHVDKDVISVAAQQQRRVEDIQVGSIVTNNLLSSLMTCCSHNYSSAAVTTGNRLTSGMVLSKTFSCGKGHCRL
jgi:hypothetical protein